jgi:hypothetical protein
VKLDQHVYDSMTAVARQELLAVDPNYKEVESMKLYTLVGSFTAWNGLIFEDGDIVLARPATHPHRSYQDFLLFEPDVEPRTHFYWLPASALELVAVEA